MGKPTSRNDNRCSCHQPRSSQIAGAINAHTMLEWIDATKGQQDLDVSSEAKRAWSRILCKHSVTSAEDSTDSVRDVGRAPLTSALTRAKPRQDAVCMFLFREWFRLVKSESAVNLYLFNDGSLQWKGRELYASWVDRGPVSADSGQSSTSAWC